MKESDIIQYIESPDLLKHSDINQLKKLLNEFPFYQTAHILLLKSLKVQNSDDFENQLSKSSIHISDRDILFRFLNQGFDKESEEEIVSEESEEEIVSEDDNPSEISSEEIISSDSDADAEEDEHEGVRWPGSVAGEAEPARERGRPRGRRGLAEGCLGRVGRKGREGRKDLRPRASG